MSLINLNNVTIGFGGPLLLDGVNLQVQAGERLCLLGRNGTGKTTLMRLINGDILPDSGTISRQQGFVSGMLTQDVPQQIAGTVFDVVLGGLGEKGNLPMEFHHLSRQLSEQGGAELTAKLDRVQLELEASGGWEIQRQAETVITRMNLDEDALFNDLSAGMKRRVLLARALVRQPDMLLLDEPTNHLDIDTVTWLEEFLVRSRITLIFVTHDRMLVRNLATRIIELDRGRLTKWECNYDTYLERKEAVLDAEQQQWNDFDKKLAQEEVWIRRGIKARRTRDEGRVAALLRMREQKQARLEQLGNVRMHSQEAQRSGKLVLETEKISFSYGPTEKPMIKDFSTLIMRGDRVGIIGPNGCGKTTLLRLLLNELDPQSGTHQLGTNLDIAYFDQLRNQLDDGKSVRDNIAEGGDLLGLDGKTRHVIGYLQDFLFSPDRARSSVKILSGGERNRLLLAKLFAKPSNLIALDEPTNDLDVETLELLEELLINYKGTLLLVSHDRTFLNNVVTSTLVFEGEDGNVNEYIGGYDDWLMQRPRTLENAADDSEANPTETKSWEHAGGNVQRNGLGKSLGNGQGNGQVKSNGKSETLPRKLTNKENLELETLPGKIEKLEAEEEALYKRMAAPEFYQENRNGDAVTQTNKRLEAIKTALIADYQRWEDLEELKARYLKFKKI